jgi:hypothetical protein
MLVIHDYIPFIWCESMWVPIGAVTLRLHSLRLILYACGGQNPPVLPVIRLVLLAVPDKSAGKVGKGIVATGNFIHSSRGSIEQKGVGLGDIESFNS